LTLSAPGAVVWAGDDVNMTKTVDPAGIIRIHNVRGDIEIRGWERSEVHVEGELDDLAEGLTFEVKGEETIIRVVLPEKHVNWGDGSDLYIRVPSQSRLKVDAVSADVEVEEVTGAIAVRSVSGDVEVSGMGTHTQINTVSGDVEISEGHGMLKVVTLSGDVDAEVSATDLLINTMSGEVDLELEAFDTLDMKSVNGSLRVVGHLNAGGKLTAGTVNGDIELALREPVNAQIHASTVASGHIENSLTPDEPERLVSRQLVLRSTVGDGSGRIRLSTVNGDIELE
jgi:DUF4097 and DUF4098 domain-containing protein YvlB